MGGAAFFKRAPLLEAWRAAGKPEPFMYPSPDHEGENEKINKRLLAWLDCFDQGRALPCKVNKSKQRDIDVSKLEIGV